jgi:Zn-finger domain-containing protein
MAYVGYNIIKESVYEVIGSYSNGSNERSKVQLEIKNITIYIYWRKNYKKEGIVKCKSAICALKVASCA